MERLISHRDSETTERKFGVFNALMGTFLVFNLVIRFCTIFNYPPYNGYIGALFGGVVSGCIFVIFFPKYLKAFLFLFGFSFFLFGFGSIDIQSRVFELIVTCVATSLFVINHRAGRDSGQWSVVSGQKGRDSGYPSEIGFSKLHGVNKKAQKLKKEKDLTTEKTVSHPSTISRSYGAGRAHREHREGRDNDRKIKTEDGGKGKRQESGVGGQGSGEGRKTEDRSLESGVRSRGSGKDTPVEHPAREPGSTLVPSFGATGQAGQGGRLNRRLVVLILCYVGLSLFSLLLLPVRTIVKDLWFFGFPDSFYYLFIGPPQGFYYPVVAVIRLMLFVVLAFTLATIRNSREIFKFLFSGIFSGAVFCAFIGLLDFYGIISLAKYRFGVTASVLQSTFRNRGWFAEFILSVVPFVLIGFMSKIRGLWWKIVLLCSLVICEIALILSGGRAGWVSYPVVLFICWLFFWFSKEGRLESFHFRWRDLVKIAVSVPITIVISLVLIFFVLMPLSDHLKSKGGSKGAQKGSKATKAYIVSQTARLVEPRGRIRAWTQGVDVGRESPAFGLGYESFSWQANILSAIPKSYYTIYKSNKHSWVLQTPHNVFFSIFASGGIIGVCLWFLLAGYAVMILTFDLIRNKRLLNTPVIISIISFHIFGIFQTMQYIPMIWSIIFLCLGYAMTIDEGVLPGRLRRVFGILTKVSVVLVIIGFFVYLNNFESRSLAEKYGLKIYAMDQDRDKFAGFFQHSKRWKYGGYRWSGKRGSILTSGQWSVISDQKAGKDGGQGAVVSGHPSEIRSARHSGEFHGVKKSGVSGQKGKEQRTEKDSGRGSGVSGQKGKDRSRESGVGVRRAEDGWMNGGVDEKKGKDGGRRTEEIEFYCRTPGVVEEPVVLKVFHDGKLIDTIIFRKEGAVKRRYELRKRRAQSGERGAQGEEGKEQRLVLEVSRTWIPHETLGNFDRRELGVGVKIHKK